MNTKLQSLFQQLTFQRQLGITVTLGILFWQCFLPSWDHGKVISGCVDDLIEQGQRITENLARQSSLALIYSSADNATEAVNATMAFPGVVGLEIRNAKGMVLLARGNANLAEFINQPGTLMACRLPPCLMQKAQSLALCRAGLFAGIGRISV
jgi:hypothetical protein